MMRDFPSIKTPTLDELLKRVPGWSTMPPAEAIAAIGRAEADDVIKQYDEAVAHKTTPSS